MVDRRELGEAKAEAKVERALAASDGRWHEMLSHSMRTKYRCEATTLTGARCLNLATCRFIRNGITERVCCTPHAKKEGAT